MRGVLGLKSLSYWPQNSILSTTLFSFLALCSTFGSTNRRSRLEAPCFFCQHQFMLVAWRVGHTLQTWYRWEDEGVLDGKDTCYIMVQTISHPLQSGGHVTSTDKLFLWWNIFRHTPHCGIRLSEWFISPPVFHLEVCPVSCHYHVCSGHYSLYTTIAVSEIQILSSVTG